MDVFEEGNKIYDIVKVWYWMFRERRFRVWREFEDGIGRQGCDAPWGLQREVKILVIVVMQDKDFTWSRVLVNVYEKALGHGGVAGICACGSHFVQCRWEYVSACDSLVIVLDCKKLNWRINMKKTTRLAYGVHRPFCSCFFFFLTCCVKLSRRERPTGPRCPL